MSNSAALVPGVQQGDSVTHTPVSVLSQVLLPFRLLQNIEESSYGRSLVVVCFK